MKNLKHPLRLVVVIISVLGASLDQGRDWFVRAGSAGDGTKEKPFKVPYLASDRRMEMWCWIHKCRSIRSGGTIIATRMALLSSRPIRLEGSQEPVAAKPGVPSRRASGEAGGAFR